MRTLIPKLLIAFFLVPAYGIAQEKTECHGDRDCLSTEFRCESDSDCMGFEFCDNGECVFPMAEWRKGLEMEIRGGLSTCIPIESSCGGRVGEIKPGGGGGIFVGIRPNPRFVAGIDFGYFAFGHDLEGGYAATFDQEEGSSIVPEFELENDDYDHLLRFLNVMAEIRGYAPFGYKSGWGDLYLKLGVGYLSFKEEYSIELIDMVDIYPRSVSSFFNLKIGFGTTFYLIQDSPKGDIGLGVNMDYLIFFTKGDVLCGTHAGNGDDSVIYCEKRDGYSTRFHTMQFTAHLKWVWPLFNSSS